MKRLIFVVMLSAMVCVLCCQAADGGFDALYRRYRSRPMPELKQLGQQLLSRNSTDSALAIYTIMSNRYETDRKPEDRVYAVEARNSLGVLAFLNSNYASAYSHFVTAVEMDGRKDAAGNQNLSAIYLYYGDSKRAYGLLRQVFDEAVSEGHYQWASTALINILTSRLDSDVVHPDSLADLIRRYNSRVPQTDDNPAWELAGCLSRASLFRMKHNWPGAVSEYKKALMASRTMLIPSRNDFASYLGLGETYREAGMNDSAVYYMRKGEEIARRHGYTELLITACSALSDLYAAAGDRRMADEYRHKKLELNDSVFNTREFGKIRDLEMFHQADRFEKRIAVLQVEEKMRTRMLVIVSVALLVVIALCVRIFIQNRSLKRKNRNLYERTVAAIKAEEGRDRAILDMRLSEEADCEGSAGDMEPVLRSGTGESPAGETSGQNDSDSGSVLVEMRRRRLEARILEVMADEKTFCREGFTIKDLADMCGSNQKYVSQVLNERLQTSFTQLLNERRVAVACKRFVDFEHYGHLTIEAIVGELGFRSRSTFSKTFKRITGLSPSEFQRMARTGAAPGPIPPAAGDPVPEEE